MFFLPWPQGIPLCNHDNVEGRWQGREILQVRRLSEIRALQHQLLCFPVRSQRARCSTRVRNGRDPGKTLSGGRWEREEERAAKRLSQEGGVLGRQPKLYSPIVGQPDTVCEGQQGHFPTFKSWKEIFLRKKIWRGKNLHTSYFLGRWVRGWQWSPNEKPFKMQPRMFVFTSGLFICVPWFCAHLHIHWLYFDIVDI